VTCSSGCPAPTAAEFGRSAYWWVRSWLTWPRHARQLKRAGFRHTGWMTWEIGPDD
jgi:hypothetical protein